MPFQKGHKINEGNHNVGRKSAVEEFAKFESIKKAWDKINREIDEQPVKDIALPLALRDMVNKSDVTTDGKPIYMPFSLIEKNESTNEPTSEPGINSEGQTQI